MLELTSWPFAAALAVVGGAGLVGGLVWLIQRDIRDKHDLPPERYRGPSVLLLLFLAVVVGNLLALIPLFGQVAGGDGLTDMGPGTVAALLLLTPLVFGAVVVVFVLRPRALAGLRLTDGPRTGRTFAVGVALGGAGWVVATLLSLVLSKVYEAVTGSPPVEEQLVVDLAAQLPPLVAVLLVGILAPVAEELFFRGVALNAWEREYGTTRAVLGTTVLFTAAHVVGGPLLALPPIFLLGLMLGLAYVRWRSLPLNVGLHATFNGISLALLFAGVS